LLPVSHLVYDVGMYDGADTRYYLASGFRVVGVEANPDQIARLRKAFAHAIRANRLIIEPVAVGANRGMIDLHVNESDPGSSSVVQQFVAKRDVTAHTVTVPLVPLSDLLERHGVPYALKIDTNGTELDCIHTLTRDRCPSYVCVEIVTDGEDIIRHLRDIGYTGFKMISQVTFREYGQLSPLRDRLRWRARHMLGLPRETIVRRGGHEFVLEHSSGPLPDRSDGPWRSADDVLRMWDDRLRTSPEKGGWLDLHARHGTAHGQQA
jgi:FkbM family methyltransferase